MKNRLIRTVEYLVLQAMIVFAAGLLLGYITRQAIR